MKAGMTEVDDPRTHLLALAKRLKEVTAEATQTKQALEAARNAGDQAQVDRLEARATTLRAEAERGLAELESGKSLLEATKRALLGTLSEAPDLANRLGFSAEAFEAKLAEAREKAAVVTKTEERSPEAPRIRIKI
jgi:chromosome segregation ATPase